MAIYSSGGITHKVILDAGRKLFYEKGYIATHCKDIAKAAGINPGLINYHFKTKGNIAQIIYSGILTNCIEITTRLFPDESLQIRNAIELRTYWRFITKEEAYKRFIYEISLERIPHRLSKGIGTDYFFAMNEEFLFEQDKEMLKMLCMINFAVETELVMGYTEGYFNLPEEKLADYEIKLMYELMALPSDRINWIIDRSKELFSQLDIKLLSGFILDISVSH